MSYLTGDALIEDIKSKVPDMVKLKESISILSDVREDEYIIINKTMDVINHYCVRLGAIVGKTDYFKKSTQTVKGKKEITDYYDLEEHQLMEIYEIHEMCEQAISVINETNNLVKKRVSTNLAVGM